MARQWQWQWDPSSGSSGSGWRSWHGPSGGSGKSDKKARELEKKANKEREIQDRIAELAAQTGPRTYAEVIASAPTTAPKPAADQHPAVSPPEAGGPGAGPADQRPSDRATSFDPSPQAQEARRQAASRIKWIKATLETLPQNDPLRPGLESAIERAKGASKPAETPGIKLDRALRNLAVVESKAKRAREEADRATRAAVSADAEVAQAVAELQEARRSTQPAVETPAAQPLNRKKVVETV